MSNTFVEQELAMESAAQSWQRWDMGELQSPRKPVAATPQDKPSTPSADADLLALRQQVIEDAKQVGFKEGYDAGLQQGYEEGIAKGQEDGLKQALETQQQQINDTLAPLLPLGTAFAQALKELDAEIGQDLVDLAMSTGRQLAGEALKARPKQVLEIVRELLHTDPSVSGQPRLWLHPKDHALVEEYLGQELTAAGWALQPDDQISRGGCRVTSYNGELDATWESRWLSVKRKVRRRKAPAAAPTTPVPSSDDQQGAPS